MVQPLWKTIGSFLYSETYTYYKLGNPTVKYLPNRNKDICPHKDLHANDHRKNIHNNPKLETTQMSLNGWMI